MNATKVLWIRGSRDRPAAELCAPAAAWTVEHVDAATGIDHLTRQDYGVIVLEFPIDITSSGIAECPAIGFNSDRSAVLAAAISSSLGSRKVF